jgi:hypothetical protein
MKMKMKQKPLVPLCLTMLLILSAGCTGLTAKSDTAKTIAADAVTMKARIASTQPAVDLAANAASFRAYYDGATVNLLTYLFDSSGKKTIYCTAKIYGDLQGMTVRADEYSTRAQTQPVSDSNALRLKNESAWMDAIERERTGK